MLYVTKGSLHITRIFTQSSSNLAATLDNLPDTRRVFSQVSQRKDAMTLFLWTLQIVLGILFTLHGAALALAPPPLQETVESLPYPKGFLQFIGVCEFW